MSHTVTVKLIADQEIKIGGKEVNIHNIKTIVVDNMGKIIEAYLDKYSPNGELLEGVGDYIIVAGHTDS